MRRSYSNLIAQLHVPPSRPCLLLKSKRDNHLNPERLLLKKADNELVRQAVEELPPEFRELIVPRGWEGLSYKQIATVVEIPEGTVMSRRVPVTVSSRGSVVNGLRKAPQGLR